MKRVALVLSFVIAAAGATFAGISNADRLIPGIHERFPWMRGPCEIWSWYAFLAVFGLAVGGLILALIARPGVTRNEVVVVRLSILASGLVVGYWLIAAFANFGETCIA
jgi:hypothetical protein